MAGEKPLSSLFGDMQGTPSGSTPASTPLPDKKADLLGMLDNLSAVTDASQVSPPAPKSTGLFGEVVPEKIEAVGETSETLPEVEILSTSSPYISPISSEVSLDTANTSLPENVEIIGTTLPEIETPVQPDSLLSDSGTPVVELEVLPMISEDVSLPEGVIPPTETSDIPDVSLPEVKTESVSSSVSEIVPIPTVLPESPESNNSEETKTETEDPKMAQYLRADAVYQEMLKVEDQEKIRLQLAVRYTLLMFAIFLVFAWIVSNRVIMLGFSEFVWLARIRDALFAIMAGLFSLTLWFGSVLWMRQIYLISLLRTLAIVLFVLVLFALYLPF